MIIRVCWLLAAWLCSWHVMASYQLEFVSNDRSCAFSPTRIDIELNSSANDKSRDSMDTSSQTTIVIHFIRTEHDWCFGSEQALYIAFEPTSISKNIQIEDVFIITWSRHAARITHQKSGNSMPLNYQKEQSHFISGWQAVNALVAMQHRMRDEPPINSGTTVSSPAGGQQRLDFAHHKQSLGS